MEERPESPHLCTQDTDTNHPTLFPPSSPDFHGFGPETSFPQRLVLDTKGEGDEEQVVKVYRMKKTGRPSAGWEKDPRINEKNIVPNTRRLKAQEDASTLRSEISSPATPTSSKATPKRPPGTSSRPKYFLLDKVDSTFKMSKLPKSKTVLSNFLFNLDEEKLDKISASKKTLDQVKEIWKHHFGERVILGFDSNLQENTKRMIIEDKDARNKILSIWKQWMDLERTSRRPDRATKSSFLKKVENFETEVLEMPFNLARIDCEIILKNDSGITDWKEDFQHLQNQLQRDQPGSCDGLDLKQKKKDDRKVLEKIRANAKKVTGDGMDDIEDDEIIEELGDDDHEEEFVVKNRRVRNERTKIDVMGPVTATADRLGLSVRDRTMMAASVANVLGVSLDRTNISKNSAWNRSKQERVRISNTIKEDFIVPEKLVLHWDGKILKIKGNQQSNRVCVYITGVTAQNVRKLLAVPETKDGTGSAEAEVVKDALKEWSIKDEVCAFVFDTTSSNSGAENGACKCLEDWLGFPVLWLACRHHIHELHLKRIVQGVTGVSKDPGVALFRRLRSDWRNLVIDYSNLSTMDYTMLPEWLQQEAKSVLEWAEKELEKNTWPREDYRELLRLSIMVLGGTVPGFQFLQPGPDHHARWMSKALYYLKMKLLLNIFNMSDEEKEQVEEISRFVVTLYVKAWFQSPLPTAAARNDLAFLANMSRYRLITKPTIAMSLLQSCYRHLWYLTPQTIVLALADPYLAGHQKEEMARKLHSLERLEVSRGKPVFPYISLGTSEAQLPDLSALISSDSWLIFDHLGLTGSQDWMTIPASMWENFAEFRKFKDFAENISVCNDIAERGVALISAFINKAQSEEQRQALLQVVEMHRDQVVSTNKSDLNKC